jgi:hypothetical protein
MRFETQQAWRICEHGSGIWLREALAAQEVEEDLRVAPPHVGIILTLGGLITEMPPSIDDLFRRSSADAQLQPLARDEIGSAGVFGHVEGVFVPHVDHRRSDLDAAGLRANGRQQGKGRGELTGEMVDTKIRSVRAQLLRGDGQVDGLQKRVSGGAGL